MKQVILTEFSGGIQEALSPDEFDNDQWAILKGIVPRDKRTFESQWSAQKIGNITGVQAIYPLSSQVGTFLVAIKTNGEIWWCKAPAENATYLVTADPIATPWAQLTGGSAVNKGFKDGDNDAADQPPITIPTNNDYRFITGLPFQVYKYAVQPVDGKADQFFFDEMPDTTDDDGASAAVNLPPRSVVSGVLIHSRRYYSSGIITATSKTSCAVVAYVDPNASSGAGAVKAVTFPNIRRWPTYLVPGSPTTPGADLTGTYDPVPPYTIGSSLAGSNRTFLTLYPFGVTVTGFPKPHQIFHPYTWLDSNKTLLPGSGIIPRGNVGTMFGNLLLIGDIEWRSGSALTAKQDPNIAPSTFPVAPIGSTYHSFGLRDGNTEPHRGSFYYSEDDIDKFDPRSVIRASSTDTRIAGMHVLDNRIIVVTTAGSDSDGVIAYTGDLTQLHSYDPRVAANPLAIKKQIVRGGVGVADRVPDAGGGHINQTCVWSEVGNVCFVDRLGGVFTTNGSTCDRIDRSGPKQPSSSTYEDHVAAVDNHLVVWRDSRLLLFSIISSADNAYDGCWTELVPPVTISSKSSIKSMVGSGRSLYMVGNGQVWRYALAADMSERGTVNGSPITQTIATRTVGDLDKDLRVNWFQASMSFSTSNTCTLTSMVVKAGPALQPVSPTPNPGTSQISSYTAFSGSRSFTNGYYTVEFPAGIGPQPQISMVVQFTGQVELEAAAFWYTGASVKSGGTQ